MVERFVALLLIGVLYYFVRRWILKIIVHRQANREDIVFSYVLALPVTGLMLMLIFSSIAFVVHG